jgi:hypothetical protein
LKDYPSRTENFLVKIGKKLEKKKENNENFPWLGYPKWVHENFSIDGKFIYS